MRTLREDGIRKVLAGMTTAAEVIEITSRDSTEPAATRSSDLQSSDFTLSP